MARGSNFGETPKQALLAKRRARALRLRCAGYTIPEILQKIPEYGGEKQLRADLRRTLRKMIDEPAKELLALQYARYERLLKSVYHVALTGDLQAFDRALKTIEQQTKLFSQSGMSSGESEGSDVEKWITSLLTDTEEA